MDKRVASLPLVIAVALVPIFILLVLLNRSVSADELCVHPSGGPCTHTTIQAAINAASPGDVIKVLAATYNENLVIDKNLTLLGGYDDDFSIANRTPRASIVEGGGTGSVIQILGGADVIVDGFTITGGDATSDGGTGGGVYIQEATVAIIDNLIEGNVGSSDPSTPGIGGGIFAITGAVTINSNTISANVAYLAKEPHVDQHGLGGGIWVDSSSSATISHNHILSNTAARAGGSANIFGGGGGVGGSSPDGVITIQDNLIKGNIANNFEGDASGGGIALFDFAEVNVTDNDIVMNTASMSATNTSGGGIFVRKADTVTIHGNRIAENTASVIGRWTHGGGIATNSINKLVLTDNQILSNTAVITTTGIDLNASGGGINIRGDDVSSDTVLIENNLVKGNLGARSMTHRGRGHSSQVNGGGLSLGKISITQIISNEFQSNTGVNELSHTGSNWLGGSSGGGLHLSENDSVTIADNLIQDNITVQKHDLKGGRSEDQAGGVALQNNLNVIFTDNQIFSNMATVSGSIAAGSSVNYKVSGGGVFASCLTAPSCDLSIESNQIANNTAAGAIVGTGAGYHAAGFGGAMNFVDGMQVNMHHNFIHDNKTTATGFGPGSIDIWQSNLASNNDVLIGNTGGMALGTDGAPVSLEVANGTFYDNGDVAIDVYTTNSVAKVRNTIIDKHHDGLRQGNGGSLTSDYNLLHNNGNNYAGGVLPGANDFNGDDPNLDFAEPAQEIMFWPQPSVFKDGQSSIINNITLKSEPASGRQKRRKAHSV